MRHGLCSKVYGKEYFARGSGGLGSFVIAAATFGETQSTLGKLDLNFNLTLIPLTRVLHFRRSRSYEQFKKKCLMDF
ncbi:DNA-directed RNA polymerase subunit beta' [Frankliniella fusca]|uniref:DNA-directed RNA polymerase subunit beta n=1 Tax=Frankliniella fusca TaxID=407009 RepID=A0AAE1HVL7_9NEOP|nr:DNA-directed RNA polymerase subunit beta' [Frankliniella fusca]